MLGMKPGFSHTKPVLSLLSSPAQLYILSFRVTDSLSVYLHEWCQTPEHVLVGMTWFWLGGGHTQQCSGHAELCLGSKAQEYLGLTKAGCLQSKCLQPWTITGPANYICMK